MDDDSTIWAEPVDGEHPWLEPGEIAPSPLFWETLTRVSGTPTDGVWRGSTLVSPIFSGSWLVTTIRDYGTSDSFDVLDISALGETVELGSPPQPTWTAEPAPAGPVKVVTGSETWVPRARITNRESGAGVPAFWLDYNFFGEPVLKPSVQVAPGTPLPNADAQGYLTLSTKPVKYQDGQSSRHVIHVYGGRGSRGYSWEAGTVLWPYVKWQASQRFAVSGHTVTASGNAWPAPAIYFAANPTIHLQQLFGRSAWRTVASAQVRSNGRYTITWTAPTSGPQVLRVYKPGGTSPNGFAHSAGTILGAVTVTVP